MKDIALLLIGFSVFYAVVLILTHSNTEHRSFRSKTHYMGVLLLLSLIGLQLSHYFYFQQGSAFINSDYYLFCLFLVAPSFYFYARPMLKADSQFGVVHGLHFVPLISLYFLNYLQAFSFAFMIGSVYLLWLLKTIYALKNHREQFKSELIILGVVFLIALIVSVLALTMPIAYELFVTLYASAVGLALIMVALVISFTPKISENVSAAARETYAVSTLKGVDCELKLAELKTMMHLKKLYQQSNLDLQIIAS